MFGVVFSKSKVCACVFGGAKAFVSICCFIMCCVWGACFCYCLFLMVVCLLCLFRICWFILLWFLLSCFVVGCVVFVVMCCLRHAMLVPFLFGLFCCFWGLFFLFYLSV